MWLFQRQAAAARRKAKAKTAKRKARKQKPWPKLPYDPTKVKRIPATPKQIDQLVSLSKGEVSVFEGDWFYRQFISFSSGLAKNSEQVRHYLQKAYWVEEEDIRQQVRVILWLFEKNNSVILDEFFKLSQMMRVYLIRDEKIFQPDRSRVQAMYQYEIELSALDEEITEEPPSLDIVLENNKSFNTFDRYVFYLHHCLGQNDQQLAKSLLLGIENAINIKRSLNKRIKESEETHGRSQDTKRYSQTTLAVFTSG